MTFEIRTISVPSANAEVDRILKEMNADVRVGRGAFAEVMLIKGKDQVVKVVEDVNDCKYAGFVKRMSSLKRHNPFLPRIDGALIIKGNDTKTMLVAMERLQPLTDFVTEAQADAVVGMMESMLEDAWEQRRSKKGTPRFLVDGVSMMWQGQHLARELKVAARVIGHPDDYDFHCDNVMVRSGRQLVITDPVA